MSIFKDTFHPFVQDQLNARQSLNSQNFRGTNEEILWHNSRNSYARLTSCVDIVPGGKYDKYFGFPGNQLATKFVLDGGNPGFKDGNFINKVGVGSSEYAAYSGFDYRGGGKFNAEYGLAPMPGITDVNIRNKSAYGSLREAIVKIECHNIAQLEALEILYMRPGFSIFLDWGWTTYPEKSAGSKINLRNTAYDVSTTLDLLFGDNGKFPTKKEIFNILYNPKTGIVANTQGCVDAMFGYIKNFTWSAREDGGYSCTVTIISIGEVIEALKIGGPAELGERTDHYARNGAIEMINNDDEIISDLGYQVLKAWQNDKFLGTMHYWASKARQLCLESGFTLDPTGLGELAAITSNPTDNVDHVSITNPYDSNKKFYFLIVNTEFCVTDLGGESSDGFGYNLTLQNSNITTPQSEYPALPTRLQVYIRLRDLIEIINNEFTLKVAKDQESKTEDEFFTFSLIDDDGNPTTCNAFPGILSVNPTTCLLKTMKEFHNSKRVASVISNYYDNNTAFDDYNVILGQQTDFLNEVLFYANDNLTRGNIGNIMVNMDLVESLYDSKLTGEEIKKVNLVDYIKSLLNKISNAIGGLNKFELQSDPRGDIVRIIDINYTENLDKDKGKPKFEFNLFKVGEEKGSIARTYSLESAVYAEQASMIAISSQAEVWDGADDVDEGFISFNRGLIDRIIPAKTASKKKKTVTRFEKLRDHYVNFLEIVPYIRIFYTYGRWFSQDGSDKYTHVEGKYKKYVREARRLHRLSKTYPDLLTDISKAVDAAREKYKESLLEEVKKVVLTSTNVVTSVNLSNLFAGKPLVSPKYWVAFKCACVFSKTGKDSKDNLDIGFWSSPFPSGDINAFNPSGYHSKPQSHPFNNTPAKYNSYFNLLWRLSDPKYDYLKKRPVSIMPVKMKLTLDGIGGLVVGQVFKVNKDFLPRGYKTDDDSDSIIGFIVTGVDHSIRNGDWTTDIDTQTCVLDDI